MEWSQMRLPGLDENAVAVVLGAGGAMGLETARALLAMGATVAVVTRSAERSRTLANSLSDSGKAFGFEADLEKPVTLAKLADQVATQCGPAAALVNCAAVGMRHQGFETVTWEQAHRMVDTNVLGAIEAMKVFAPQMRQHGAGKIVNVSSISGLRVVDGGALYGLSKAALVSASQHIAVELGPDRINVNVISPGQTPTRIRYWDAEPGRTGAPKEASGGPYEADSVPLRRRGELADYVGAILFLCSSLADYITGADIPVEGGVRLVRARSY